MRILTVFLVGPVHPNYPHAMITMRKGDESCMRTLKALGGHLRSPTLMLTEAETTARRPGHAITVEVVVVVGPDWSLHEPTDTTHQGGILIDLIPIPEGTRNDPDQGLATLVTMIGDVVTDTLHPDATVGSEGRKIARLGTTKVTETVEDEGENIVDEMIPSQGAGTHVDTRMIEGLNKPAEDTEMNLDHEAAGVAGTGSDRPPLRKVSSAV
jgi:hypothetical protein